jgi:hypothetical protein
MTIHDSSGKTPQSRAALATFLLMQRRGGALTTAELMEHLNYRSPRAVQFLMDNVGLTVPVHQPSPTQWAISGKSLVKQAVQAMYLLMEKQYVETGDLMEHLDCRSAGDVNFLMNALEEAVPVVHQVSPGRWAVLNSKSDLF